MSPKRLECVVLGRRDDGAWEIGLTRGLAAVIDEADLPAVVAAGKWFADPSNRIFYARRGSRGNSVKMHSFLTGWPYVDHINGNGLDNRRSNLRPSTHAQNTGNAQRPVTNTSGYKGASWHKGQQKWTAQIHHDGRTVHLGTFETVQEAARAYDVAAITFRGEFARPNFEQAS